MSSNDHTQTRDQHDFGLIFERGGAGMCAVSLPDSDVPTADRVKALGSELVADAPPPLPQVGELDLVRHYTRLAHRCFSIDENFYPLGSCTMKYNPRLCERAAGLPGFADLHPYQDEADVQGLLALLYQLRVDLAEIAGLAEVTLQPAAGAHGEMTGLMIISAYHRHRGQQRRTVLAPETAHGTNPATCTICGKSYTQIPCRKNGRMDLDALRKAVNDDTAALMITNPNTVGVYDEQIADMAEILHKKGALLYLDGANMNAIMGIARPGDFGVDVMHYNTHKTFSTPHGCGGPGAGPVAVAEHLREFLPVPQVVKRSDGRYGWETNRPKSIGKVRSFYGQSGVLVRAASYIRSLGGSGLRNVSEKAVLAANYLAARLKDHYELPFPPPYAHEFIALPKVAEDSKLGNVEFCKRLLDYGIHPPTMSFPVHHCLMIEPTETESLQTLDHFVASMVAITKEAAEQPDLLKNAPHTTPIRRMDEVAANRKVNPRWVEPS